MNKRQAKKNFKKEYGANPDVYVKQFKEEIHRVIAEFDEIIEQMKKRRAAVESEENSSGSRP